MVSGRTKAARLAVAAAVAARLELDDARSSAKCEFTSLIKWEWMILPGSIPGKVFVNVLRQWKNKYCFVVICY